MLRTAFQMASLAVSHTSIAATIAYIHGGHASPWVTGATSLAVGLVGLTSGAFAGHHLYDSRDGRTGNTGATLLGYTGYGAASYLGFIIR